VNKSQRFKQKSVETFDNQAQFYDSTYYGQHAHKLYDYVIATMNKYNYKNVLDVGCGTGNILMEVLKRKNITVSGIDLSENMLDIAKSRLGEKADLRKGDSESLPWKNGLFDIVICTESFHHYPNPKAVLTEMKRVLSLEGKIIIADPWLPSPFRQIANLFMPFNKDGDIKMYSCTDLKKLLIDCELDLFSWEKVDNSAFIAVVGI
jgi:ubiquinone/menaquinone biosynthesis C-methylase UbiE